MTTEQEWTRDRAEFVRAQTCGGALDGARDDAEIGPLAREFAALSARLLNAETQAAVLEHVAYTAKAVVHGAELASVTLRTADDCYLTAGETDERATRLDELQYEFDEGPCVEATRRAGLGVAFAADLAGAPGYPRFGPAAARHGVRCLLAVGLFPIDPVPRTGALNLYSTRPGGLDRRDLDVAVLLAAHASTALAGRAATAAAEQQTVQLGEALRSRDVIGQAKGILMERRGVDAGEAFDILRKVSQELNVKLVQIAQTVASRRADL